MKLKWLASSFITFSLVLIIVLFYVHSLIDSQNLVNINPRELADLPTELHPVVKERTDRLIRQSADRGIAIVITDGFRSVEDQDKLYAQGRSDAGNIVTHAKGGESYHNFGLAVDFALRTPSSDVVWDMQYDGNANGTADWMEVVEMAKALGFEWGGDWARFKDYPHLEMNFGLSIAQLQRGERPPNSSLTAEQTY